MDRAVSTGPGGIPLHSPRRTFGWVGGRTLGIFCLLEAWPSHVPGPAHLAWPGPAFRRGSGFPSPSGIRVVASGDRATCWCGSPGQRDGLPALPGPLRPPFLSRPRSLGPWGAGLAFGKIPPPPKAHAASPGSEEGAQPASERKKERGGGGGGEAEALRAVQGALKADALCKRSVDLREPEGGRLESSTAPRPTPVFPASYPLQPTAL